MFPTGIEKEVIFMEITGKLLLNLYASCHVSNFPITSYSSFLEFLITAGLAASNLPPLVAVAKFKFHHLTSPISDLAVTVEI